MHRISLLFVCVIFIFNLSHSQTHAYPKGYFRWPVNLPPDIVANLGELRPNHWHMGLDVRTNGKVNQEVFAAAEGYIAYVGIRAQSFGRFIIINHPNGLSTLYAHLNDFAPILEKYVTDQQYKQQKWAVELDIPKGMFPVAKGSFISYSGTTGGSQGPHVHFEIRETSSGKCLNPLLFGFPLPDQVAPTIQKLAIYDRSRSSYESNPRLLTLKKTEAGYTLPLIKTGSTRVSFGLQAFDRRSGSNNQDGIYSAWLSVDGRKVIGFVIDSISYSETLYMNAHVDYPLKYRGGPFIQHLSALPGEKSSVYHAVTGLGVIDLIDTTTHDVQIAVRDAAQNVSYLKFKIQYNEALASPASALPGNGVRFIPNQAEQLDKPEFEATLTENSVYDTVDVSYYKTPSNAVNSVSAIHQLGDASIPVHDNLIARLMPDKEIPGAWRNKIVVQRTSRNSRNVRKALWDGQWMSAEFGDFGAFQAFSDTESPTINQLGGADTINLSSSSRILFTPSDNSGIKSFRAELDGSWLRFTNDKGRSWIYSFDERCPYGTHQLKVTLEDLVGNQTIKTWWFKRSPYTAPPPPRKKSMKKGSNKTKSTGKKSASSKAKPAKKKKK